MLSLLGAPAHQGVQAGSEAYAASARSPGGSSLLLKREDAAASPRTTAASKTDVPGALARSRQ